jgi:hypothetical protein
VNDLFLIFCFDGSPNKEAIPLPLTMAFGTASSSSHSDRGACEDHLPAAVLMYRQLAVSLSLTPANPASRQQKISCRRRLAGLRFVRASA